MKKIDKTHSPRCFLHSVLGLALVLFALQAHGKTSRDVISMTVRDASVSSALRQVNTVVGETIVSYKTQEVAKETKKVNARMNDVTVLMAVNTIIDGTNLRAIDRQSDVLVVPASVRAQAPQQPARQQQHNIGGTVVDEQGKPMTGVAVQVAGTGRGTSTDARGQFVLSGIQLPATMAFSFMGYETREVRVTTDEILQVTLQRSTIRLESAIVETGYQRRDRNQAVGSFAVAGERELEMAPSTTWDKALQGKVAGLLIQNVSGRPGESGKIQIRGINTLTGNTEPLYVLDGMPLQPGEAGNLGEDSTAPDLNDLMTNGIGNIPPENIKSITILKDATAASIYGARAANGVIVIETKMGQVGTDYLNYTGKFGITMAPKNRLGMMNSSQKVDFEEALYNDFRGDNGGRAILTLYQRDNGMISPAEAERQLNILRGTNTDWMDVLYDNAFTQSHNISLSGGNDRTQYFSAINYQNSQGTLMENSYQSGGINMKVNRRVRDNLLVKTNLYSTFKKNREGQAGMDPFTYATFANTYEKPYNDDGSYASDMTYRDLANSFTSPGTNGFTDFNIVKELRENTLTSYYGNMRGQLGVEWHIINGLRYNFDGAIDYTFINNIDEARPGTYRAWVNNWLNSQVPVGYDLSPSHNKGFLDESSSRTFNYTVRNSLEWSKNFDKHFMQVFGASEFGGARYNGFNNYMPMYLWEYRIAGYPSWALADPTLYSKLPLAKLGGSRISEDRSASFIGSAVYSYDNRYVANFNVRYDGVDILGTDNQFSPLWSAGVKWNAHNEKFLEGMSNNISRLALSVGYGYRGSINRSVYPFNVYRVGTAIYDNEASAYEFLFGNPAIKWEKKRELNLGLELSLWRGRFNADVRYFNERVTDLLERQQLPVSTGLAYATINIGQLTNRGLEVSLRAEVIRNENLLWEVGGNITTVKNNLEKAYNEFLPELPPRSGYTPITNNVQNYPLNGWFGYKFSHVDPTTGNMIVWAQKRQEHKNADGTVSYTYTDEQVDLMTIDQSGLEQYSSYYLGQRDPKLYGGFNTRVVWKQFEFGANFVFASGNTLLNFRERDSGPSSGVGSDLNVSRTNRTLEAANRWRQYGDVTNIARFTDSRTLYTNYLVSNDLSRGNYLKCTEMSLSWRAPRKVLESTRFSTLRVSLVANNLFTLTRYKGIDPELATPFGYPATPSFTLSLNVGF